MIHLSQDELKEMFEYNETTGDLIRRIPRGSSKIGDVIGSNSNGYLICRIDRKMYRVHRLIMKYKLGDEFDEYLQVDHINGVKNDNKWNNLRMVTSSTNHKNMSRPKSNKSGVVGVRKERNSWRAEIQVNGKKINLGSSKSFFECVCMRKSGELRFEFHLNHGR